jgi:hypothetical protein
VRVCMCVFFFFTATAWMYRICVSASQKNGVALAAEPKKDTGHNRHRSNPGHNINDLRCNIYMYTHIYIYIYINIYVYIKCACVGWGQIGGVRLEFCWTRPGLVNPKGK